MIATTRGATCLILAAAETSYRRLRWSSSGWAASSSTSAIGSASTTVVGVDTEATGDYIVLAKVSASGRAYCISATSSGVVTYGQVAELAGRPGASRKVGAVMRSLPPKSRLPWQRVMGKAGTGRARVALVDSTAALRQKKLLQAEGIKFVNDHHVSLDQFGWLPRGL